MPNTIALPAIRNLGPQRSTAYPKAGDVLALTRSLARSAPVMTVRFHPSSSIFGLKKKPKVWAPNPTRIPWLKNPQATIYHP